MPRPCKKRRICCEPSSLKFKPAGAYRKNAKNIFLTLDEFEAIRLADLEGFYQEQAAQKMNVSRQTFGNIILSARKKVADFLINSGQLTIGGGVVEVDECKFICNACQNVWSSLFEIDKQSECPRCKSIDYYCQKRNKTCCLKDCPLSKQVINITQ